MTVRHFAGFFVIGIIRIFTMKMEQFQQRGSNSVCPGAFQLLRGHAPMQLRGKIAQEWTCAGLSNIADHEPVPT
jgi:hypothetical protein